MSAAGSNIRVGRSQFRYTTFEADVSSDNLVRIIDAFVDALDLPSLGFEEDVQSSTGRPREVMSSDYLKLLLYGARKQLDSSRDLEEACKINVEARWLIMMLTAVDQLILPGMAHPRSGDLKGFQNLTDTVLLLNQNSSICIQFVVKDPMFG